MLYGTRKSKSDLLDEEQVLSPKEHFNEENSLPWEYLSRQYFLI